MYVNIRISCHCASFTSTFSGNDFLLCKHAYGKEYLGGFIRAYPPGYMCS